ncbi:hypothetical protein PLESTB_000069600 [Pleodorina starrii]|uniref:Uncharacterized protein n=1 Tax=Pleodorina starrii TaxID=330485 RepID=A0A9W6EXN3_9CHLO|nr:hypothetical protein PLESTM_001603700 [Pleodorina starrii]GLC48196.1 hypothetical protein PLESTB_000069600 [Pleodorina starrii]GLC67441.1 hypothetical protein PLESTF_000556500 [Pleodorina starrii]
MERCFLAPAAFHRRVEPYKRLVGVLLRPTCVSIAVSNHYLTLAEPSGAFLLRDGRVPERTLLRLLKPYCSEMTGFVLGSEAYAKYTDLIAAPPAAATLRQVHAVLQSAAPGLPYVWWDRWTPDTPASCRVSPPAPAQLPSSPDGRSQTASDGAGAGDAAAPDIAAGRPGGEATQASRPDAPLRRPGSGSSGGAPCSMGTLFLQHYLDELGALNTFG